MLSSLITLHSPYIFHKSISVLIANSAIHSFIHSFITDVSIAPLEVHYYSETRPTTALILYPS